MTPEEILQKKYTFLSALEEKLQSFDVSDLEKKQEQNENFAPLGLNGLAATHGPLANAILKAINSLDAKPEVKTIFSDVMKDLLFTNLDNQQALTAIQKQLTNVTKNHEPEGWLAWGQRNVNKYQAELTAGATAVAVAAVVGFFAIRGKADTASHVADNIHGPQ